jgi:hypothetical protein
MFPMVSDKKALVSTWVSEKISVKIIPAKISWNYAVQERVSATSSMLGQMKGIKITGMAGSFSSIIQSLREQEISVPKKFRGFLVSLQALGRFQSVVELP